MTDHMIRDSKVASGWFRLYEKYGGAIQSTKEGRRYERKLIKRAQSGDEGARVELIARNAPLIVKLAKSYTVVGLSADDRVQVATIGFSRGIDDYDLNNRHQTRLYAYAVWWAKYALQELAPQAFAVHIPFNVVTAIWRFRRSGRDTPENVRYASSASVATGNRATHSVSLDEPISNKRGTYDDMTFGDVMADSRAASDTDDIDTMIDTERRVAMVEAAMSECLTPKERDIMLRRWDGGTLEQIAAVHGLTRERIRQIEEFCIAMIKEALDGRPHKVDLARRMRRQSNTGRAE